MGKKTAVIIGAGPAGLTAAYELLTRADVKPIVLEKSGEMGGISRTVKHKGNRIDIGGHRFFSKSDRVMSWWMDMLPVQATGAPAQRIAYHNATREVRTDAAAAPDPEREDRVFLVRERKSRIYYLRKFFDYPIRLSAGTLLNLGLRRTLRIGASYGKAVAFPIREEKNLEQFLINRFGRELYETFFKSYTEKVWGTACRDISAEWGAQRIKGLSITRALADVARRAFRRGGDLAQKGTETSLIEQFLYPKFGPGQMWEEAARRVVGLGGEIRTLQEVTAMHLEGGRVRAVSARDARTGASAVVAGDYFFSTMPIKELVSALDVPPPENVREVAAGLLYRDFITVGLLVKDLKLKEKTPRGERLVRDNWIYVQEPDVMVGRLQLFNNWSPWMVAERDKVWIGLEYFCNEADELWRKSDEEMVAFAKDELGRIDVLDPSLVEDAVVIRQPKTYPAYFGTYDRFDEVRAYFDGIENLFLVGRNGMHKYNNQDHSMLTAMTAVDNIVGGITDKANLWAVNAEGEYHEERAAAAAGG